MFAMPPHNHVGPLLGLEIGHHQARAVLATGPNEAQVVRLDGKREPVVIRWSDGDRSLRVIDAVRERLRNGEPGAGEIVRDLAEFLTARVAADGIDPWSTRIRVSLPTGQSSVESELVCAAFSATGFTFADRPVIPRTVSALTAYAAHHGHPPYPVVVVDNDGGVVSTASANFNRRQLGPARVLSRNGDPIDLVAHRLHQSLGPDRPNDGVAWLRTGTGADHPGIAGLCERVAPWETVVDPKIPNPEWVAVSGLLESAWLRLLLPQPISDVQPQLSRQP